ncbi:MAG: RNA polymerase sigma-70 factor [Mediterranea sp.]|jgi:RNA polymerase sigma-70 factor (ECF subfamily)|nr:RNA polymerase sigma-70 factor [Mediterranea sp.]
MQSEREDIEQLREGSSAAFERLFDQYSGKLYNFMLRLAAGNTYLAEEMTQRAFVKVWETRTAVNPERSFLSYLCTIAKNMLINEYEHQTVERLYQEHVLAHTPMAEVTTEQQVCYRLLDEYITHLTEQLPPARRQVFVLSKREMLSNREIAQQLHITESTVQTQLSKALAFMKEQLAKHYPQLLCLLLYYTFPP